MAAVSKPVVLPRDDITKEIECRVCTEQITLRILSCGHKCCQECIGQLSGGRGRLPCPICRRQVIIPEEGFPVCFISDYIREQINKPDSRVDEPVGKHCKICTDRFFEARCGDCRMFFCFRCASTDRGCTSQNHCHDAVPIEDLLAEKTKKLKQWQKKTRQELTNESVALELLKADIQETKQTICRMQRELEEKQKKADMMEKSVDERTSLLKVSEFIETEQDQSELLVLIDQMCLDGGASYPSALRNPPPPSAIPSALHIMSQHDTSDGRCLTVSGHHHSISGDVLLGCSDGMKMYRRQSGEITHVVSCLVAVVTEYRGEVFFSSWHTTEEIVEVYSYSINNNSSKMLFSFPQKAEAPSYLSVSAQYIAATVMDNNSIKLYHRLSASVTTRRLSGLKVIYNILFLLDSCLLVTGHDYVKPLVCGVAVDDRGLIYLSGLRNKKIYILNNEGIKLKELKHGMLPDYYEDISVRGDELAVAGWTFYSKLLLFKLQHL